MVNFKSKILLQFELLVISLSVCIARENTRNYEQGGADMTSVQHCPVCDMRACPLVSAETCRGTIMKDRCGCCPECRPAAETVTDFDDEIINGNETDACADISCQRYEICIKNIQGLPVCRCPTAYFCKNSPRKKGKKICSDSGETFQSMCYLKMTACEQNRKITVSRKGSCDRPYRKSKSDRAEERKQRLKERRRIREEIVAAKQRDKQINAELRRQEKKEKVRNRQAVDSPNNKQNRGRKKGTVNRGANRKTGSAGVLDNADGAGNGRDYRPRHRRRDAKRAERRRITE